MLGRKVKQNIIKRSFPEANLDCMSHYVIPTVKGNPDRIIIYCGTNNLEMDQSPEAIAKKNIELAKGIKSTRSRVKNIVEKSGQEDETIKFMRQKPFDARKHIGKDGIHFNNFGISQIVKNFIKFLNNDQYFKFGDTIRSIDMNERIQETHSIVTSNCN